MKNLKKNVEEILEKGYCRYYELAMKIEVDIKFDDHKMEDCDELLKQVGESECRKLRNAAWRELNQIKAIQTCI